MACVVFFALNQSQKMHPMTALLPSLADFNARLRLSGWVFVQSYVCVIFIAAISQAPSTATILLLAIAVTVLNLAQVAVNTGFAHFEGMRCRPDLSKMPRRRRYLKYGFYGLHWTVLMIAFFSAYQSIDGAADVVIWISAGLFFTAATAFFAERSLRQNA